MLAIDGTEPSTFERRGSHAGEGRRLSPAGTRGHAACSLEDRECRWPASDGPDRSKTLAAVRLALLPTWLVLGVFFLAAAGDHARSSASPTAALRRHRADRQPAGSTSAPANSSTTTATRSTRSTSRIFWRSLWLAVVTTVLCLVVSYPVAYYIALVAKPKWKNLLLALVAIPFWTSFLIRTYAWVLILRTEGLLNTLLLHCT